MIGTWKGNAWSMHTKFSEIWKEKKRAHHHAHADYVKDIILGGLFPPIDTVAASGESVETITKAGRRSTSVNPYVYTMHSFKKCWGGYSNTTMMCAMKL